MHRQGKVAVLAAGLLAGAVLAVGLAGCGRAREEPWPPGKSPRILTSFPPLYCFASNVAGEEAAVRCLLTAIGPHEYQATSGDVRKLLGADFFFVNGLTLDETFSSRLKDAAGNPRLRYVVLGEAVTDRLKCTHDHDHDHAHGPGQHHHHHHGEFDPHIWLGIPEAIQMVQRIRDELTQADPAQAARYEHNAAAYIERLRQLHEEGRAAFKDKKNRRLITFHESLGYFARAFGLEIVDSIQATPGVEPDSGKIARLVKECKARPVGAITLEPQYPDNTAAKALVNELKKEGLGEVATVVVDPLETAASAAALRPDWYETMMRKNIAALAKALP